MSDDLGYLLPVEGDDGFSDVSELPPAPPEQEGFSQQEGQEQSQTPPAEQTQQSDQTGEQAGEQPTFENLQPFVDEEGNLKVADLDGHFAAARSMIGRQANEIGELRARLRAYEDNRPTGSGDAGGSGQQQTQQQQSQQQQQQQQQQRPDFQVPEGYKGLLQKDDLAYITGAIEKRVQDGIRAELTNLAQQSEQYQQQQVSGAVADRKINLNTVMNTTLDYVKSLRPEFKDIPPAVIHEAVTSDPEAAQAIKAYIERGDGNAFNDQVALQIAQRVFNGLISKSEAQASAHLQQQSGPQFSPKVLPVKPGQGQPGPKRSVEELEILGDFA